MAKTTKKTTTKAAAQKAAAQKATAKAAKLATVIQTRYPHIVSIVEVGDSGKPTRVEIECIEEGCKERREIATQDAFQVVRCAAHQREHAKAARRKTPVEAPKPRSPKARKRTKTKTRKVAA